MSSDGSKVADRTTNPDDDPQSENEQVDVDNPSAEQRCTAEPSSETAMNPEQAANNDNIGADNFAPEPPEAEPEPDADPVMTAAILLRYKSTVREHDDLLRDHKRCSWALDHMMSTQPLSQRRLNVDYAMAHEARCEDLDVLKRKIFRVKHPRPAWYQKKETEVQPKEELKLAVEGDRTGEKGETETPVDAERMEEAKEMQPLQESKMETGEVTDAEILKEMTGKVEADKFTDADSTASDTLSEKLRRLDGIMPEDFDIVTDLEIYQFDLRWDSHFFEELYFIPFELAVHILESAHMLENNLKFGARMMLLYAFEELAECRWCTWSEIQGETSRFVVVEAMIDTLVMVWKEDESIDEWLSGKILREMRALYEESGLDAVEHSPRG